MASPHQYHSSQVQSNGFVQPGAPYLSSVHSSSHARVPVTGTNQVSQAKPKKKRTNARRDTMEAKRLEELRKKDKERKRLRRNSMTEEQKKYERERDKERKAQKRREQRSRSMAQPPKLPPITSLLSEAASDLRTQPHFPPQRQQLRYPPPLLPLPHVLEQSSSSSKPPVRR